MSRGYWRGRSLADWPLRRGLPATRSRPSAAHVLTGRPKVGWDRPLQRATGWAPRHLGNTRPQYRRR
eukprot:4671847-Alexandrium_andersonii.AAC.1